MTVSHAAVTITRESQYYKIAVDSGLDESIEHYYSLKYTGEGKVSYNDFAPIESVSTFQKGSKKQTATISSHDDGEIEAVEVEKNLDRNRKKLYAAFKRKVKFLIFFPRWFWPAALTGGPASPSALKSLPARKPIS